MGQASHPGPGWCSLDDPDGSSPMEWDLQESEEHSGWDSPPEAISVSQLLSDLVPGPWVHSDGFPPASCGGDSSSGASAMRFLKANAFDGQVPGRVFKLGRLGLGYYLDDRDDLALDWEAKDRQGKLAYLEGASRIHDSGSSVAPVTLSLTEMVPIATTVPRAHRKPRNVERLRSRHMRSGVVPARPMNTLLGESKSCMDHRDFGLWAIDSFNCNAMSTGQSYLEDTSADVVLFQELRTDGDSLLAAQRRAKRTNGHLRLRRVSALKPAPSVLGLALLLGRL